MPSSSNCAFCSGVKTGVLDIALGAEPALGISMLVTEPLPLVGSNTTPLQVTLEYSTLPFASTHL